MGFDSFISSIGNGLTDAADKIGDIGSSAADDAGNIFSGLTGDASSLFGGLGSGLSGILSGLGLGGLLGGSGGSGTTNWKTYLEYGGIAVGIIILAVIIKKLIA